MATAGGGRILLVCTGNQCRSPMAEALLRSYLPADSGVAVASAGTVGNGTPPPPEAVRAMADIGLDIAGRPSRPLTDGELADADLVVVMARDHLVAAATLHPRGLDRMFTLTDLLDRGARAGGRQSFESVRDWAARMSAGRRQQAILTLPSAGDVTDPMGGPPELYERVRDQLARATSELAALLCPSDAGAPPPKPRERRWRRR